MKEKLIRLEDVVDVSDSYKETLEKLENRVKDRDIPSWILVPKRSSGENPTGYAWLGIVMSQCGDDNDGVIDTRVAIDTEERDRVQSNVGNVPESIIESVEQAKKSLEETVAMCLARMEYDKESMNLQSIQLYLRVKEEETEE